MTIHTVNLPFMAIDISVAPTKVTSMDELPDFVLPFQATVRETGTGVSNVKDFALCLHFRDIDTGALDQGLTGVFGLEEFGHTTNEAAMRMTQEALNYTFHSDVFYLKLKEAFEPENTRLSKPTFMSWNVKVRRGHPSEGKKYSSRTVIQQIWDVVKEKAKPFENMIGFTQVNDHFEPRVIMHLGGRVVLHSRSQQFEPFRDSPSRIKGTMSVQGITQNFFISRPMNPSVFMQYVTPDVLQDAYQYCKDKLEETMLGRAIQLPNQLVFAVAPATEDNDSISETVPISPDLSNAEFADVSKSKIPRKWCGMERTKEQMKNLRNDSFQLIIRNLGIMAREEFFVSYGLTEPEKKAIQLAAETGKMVLLTPLSVGGNISEISVINTDGKAGIEKYLIWSDGN